MSYLADRDFLIEVARGNVAGSSLVSKFGQTPEITTSTDPQDIWDYGPSRQNYSYPSAAATLYISSSDAADAITIDVQGLDSSWDHQSQEQVVAGQTKTEVGSGLTWIRAYRAKNKSAADCRGTIYVYEDDTISAGVPTTAAKVKAVIRPTIASSVHNNQTQMALYTIPNGKTGYLLDWGASVNRTGVSGNKEADLVLRVREYGGVFQVKQNMSLNNEGTTVRDREWRGPLVFPAKSDIAVKCLEVNASGTGVSSWFDLLLIDD